MFTKERLARLNYEYASELGKHLCQRRNVSQEGLDSLADKLLLSKKQIIDLENCDLSKFYGEHIFAQSLCKYAAALNVPADRDRLLIQSMLDSPAQDNASVSINQNKAAALAESGIGDSAEPFNFLEQSALVQKTKVHRYALYIAGTLLTIAALIAVEQIFWLPSSVSGESLENVKVSESPAAVVESAKSVEYIPVSVATETGMYPFVSLETKDQCWIQLNYSDGRVTQKIYPADTSLSFDRGELSGLVIGDMFAANLEIDGKKIDLATYKKPDSKVARLFGGQVVKLLGLN